MLNQPVREDHKNIVEQGFTLVELLIVIVILGILAGIVVFAVGNLTQDASKNACATDVSTFKSAYQAFKAHNLGTKPDATNAGTVMGELTATAKGGPYLQSAFKPSNGYDATNSNPTDFDDTTKVTAGHWAFNPADGTVTDQCNA